MDQHYELALWAADCAERVLILFEVENPEDLRPRRAIEAARQWQRGELGMTEARKRAFASHAAARQAKGQAAVAAARSAGHAAATAHVATHAPHAASYARKSKQAAGQDVEFERRWQVERIPPLLRQVVAE
jgi:predicted phage gp36 major capsid-like protein